jgi:hypothetical protein
VIVERKDCKLHSWSLADRETQSHSIVVSAQGWIVVNPLGVAEPTVGGNEHPSQQLLNPGGISDKCFASGTLKYLSFNNYAHKLWNYECFHYKNDFLVFNKY